MASTVYKGDLAEVTFGHECGFTLPHGSNNGIEHFISTDGDVSTITFVKTTLTVAITSGGTGHAATDVITMPVQRGGTAVTLTVSAISGGAATVLAVTNAGTNIAVGDVLTQLNAAASTGSGTGLVATVLTVTAAASGAESFHIGAGGVLKYPAGMLVGSQMRVIGGGNYNLDDFATTGNVYNIVANSGVTLKVSPAMKETGISAAGDELMIDTIATPTIDDEQRALVILRSRRSSR